MFVGFFFLECFSVHRYSDLGCGGGGCSCKTPRSGTEILTRKARMEWAYRWESKGRLVGM